VSAAFSESTIVCPKCGAEIKLTESLAAPAVAALEEEYTRKLEEKEQEAAEQKRQLEEKLEVKVREMTEREKKILEKSQELDIQKKAMEADIALQVAKGLDAERKLLIKAEAERAKLAAARDMEEKDRAIQEMTDRMKSQEAKLAEAQKAQAEVLKKQRELEDAKREMELTIQKKLLEEAGKIQIKVKQESDESYKLKISEKDKQIQDMQKMIEELKQKAEVGSQQLQGEVQELDLENALRELFGDDKIDPVAKGMRGGDVLQRVFHGGQECGLILWESKRTKSWSDSWLPKLRGDQRAANADIAVLETQALPKEIEKFGLYEGVWITPPATLGPVAFMLRHVLIEVHSAKKTSEGLKTKTELLYQYLTGSRFKQRVEAIIEAFSTMKEDLDKERRAILKQWAKREGQINNVIHATAGMYGDLHGIAGQSMQEIEGMSFLALEEGTRALAEGTRASGSGA
jgi:hypothetical protein